MQLWYGVHGAVCNFQTSWTDHITHVQNLVTEGPALLQFECSDDVCYESSYVSREIYIFDWSPKEFGDFVQIDDRGLPLKIRCKNCHDSLPSGRRIF